MPNPLILPDTEDIPEDDATEPRDADTPHTATPEEVEK